jgi:ketosteroid isomerase-like protein
MKTILFVAAVNLLLPFVSFAQEPTSTPTSSQIVNEIRRLTRAWDKAMVKRDVAYLDTILADDYYISGLPKPQYLELLKSHEIGYSSFDRQVLSVRVYGQTALSLGQANLNGGYRSGWFSSTFEFMDVWVKQKGRWRCVATKAEQIVRTYQNEEMITFGPEVKASLVIIFKPGVKNDQIEEFRRNVLLLVASTEQGDSYLPGIRKYLRSLPNEEHEVIALTFHKEITTDQRAAIIERVRSSPFVFKLFEDLAPGRVKLNQ